MESPNGLIRGNAKKKTTTTTKQNKATHKKRAKLQTKKKNFKANTDKVTELKSHYYQLIGYQH